MNIDKSKLLAATISVAILALFLAAILLLGGCTPKSGQVEAPSVHGYGIACDQTGRISEVYMSSSGTISHQQDFTPPIQSCMVQQDGSVVVRMINSAPIQVQAPNGN